MVCWFTLARSCTTGPSWMVASLAVEPTVGSHRKRQEDGGEQHCMLSAPGTSLPSRIQEKLSNGRSGRRERIPLSNCSQPGRHRGWIDEGIGEKTDGPDQDLHRGDRLRSFGTQPEENPDPEQGKAEEQKQPDGGKGGGHPRMPTPSQKQSNSHHDRQPYNGVEQIRDAAA